MNFDQQANLEHELRLGIDFDYELGTGTTLRAGFEMVKRFEDESDLSGTIIGVNNFRFQGTDLKSFWGRASLELTHLISEDVLINLSLLTRPVTMRHHFRAMTLIKGFSGILCRLIHGRSSKRLHSRC